MGLVQLAELAGLILIMLGNVTLARTADNQNFGGKCVIPLRRTKLTGTATLGMVCEI